MPTLNLGLTNRIAFRLLVRAWYLYIYIPNSIIFLNTSDSIGLQRSPMHDSDGVSCVLDKTRGKKSGRTSKQCTVPAKTKSHRSLTESDRIDRIPSESIGLPWE
jgi:hypothetical protein